MRDELLTIQQAAAFFGVSPRTLRRWEEKGYLKPQQIIDNQPYYSKLHLTSLFKSPQSNTPPMVTSISQAPVAPAYESVSVALEQQELSPNGRKTAFTTIVTLSAGILSGIALLFFVATFLIGNQQAKSSQNETVTSSDAAYHQKSSDQQVLGINDQASDYQLNINIPSLFGKKVLFLDDVAMKKGLNVTGVAHLGGVVTNNLDINAGRGKIYEHSKSWILDHSRRRS